MPAKHEITPMDGYIVVRSTGVFDNADEVLKLAETLGQVARTYPERGMLLDQLDAVDNQDFQDAYELSESDLISDLAMLGLRLACLCTPDNLEINRAWETLLQNRSINYRAFLDRDEAVTWLKS